MKKPLLAGDCGLYQYTNSQTNFRLTLGSYTQLSVVAVSCFLSSFIVFSSVRTRDFHFSIDRI